MEEILNEFMKARDLNYPGFQYIDSHREQLIEVGKNIWLVYYAPVESGKRGKKATFDSTLLKMEGTIILIVPKVTEWIFKFFGKQKSVVFEVYSHDFFIANPLESYLTAKHRLATKEEVEDFKRNILTIGDSLEMNSSILYVDDVIARWKGFLPSQLIRIQREYPVKEFIKYRYCIKRPSYKPDKEYSCAYF